MIPTGLVAPVSEGSDLKITKITTFDPLRGSRDLNVNQHKYHNYTFLLLKHSGQTNLANSVGVFHLKSNLCYREMYLWIGGLVVTLNSKDLLEQGAVL